MKQISIQILFFYFFIRQTFNLHKRPTDLLILAQNKTILDNS